MLIPHAELATRMSWPDDAVMHRLSRRSEGLQLLRGYLWSLESRRLSAWRDARETIRRHLIDLAALALTCNRSLGESSLSAVAAARLTAALDLIATCYQRPDFSIAMVAKSQGVSQRYLQRLLEASGTSFTQRVNELRLQRAFALLSGAGDGPNRIIDVAFQAGFSDLSHFNRLFRSRFGDSPTGIRAKARRAQ